MHTKIMQIEILYRQISAFFAIFEVDMRVDFVIIT